MLEDHWHIACTSKSLKRKPKAITLFSKNIVMFRDEQGNPCALEDRCAHRNMPLHCGKLIDGQLQCPYHGWRYNRRGQVSLLPALPLCKVTQENSPSQRIKITAYNCCEQDGARRRPIRIDGTGTGIHYGYRRTD